MLQLLNKANIAIVGGGAFCRDFLEKILGDELSHLGHRVLGVADLLPDAPGRVFAGRRGIFTTDDYRHLLDLPDLNVLIELTRDDLLADEIRSARPAHLKVIDHFEAVTTWENLLIDQETKATLATLREPAAEVCNQVAEIFQAYAARITGIIHDSAKYAVTVERGLAKHERLLSQIVDGLTIPTFVINKRHLVTHWNRALEKLTGITASEVVGTNRQWAPFWPHPRPSMADVIVDQPDAAEIQRLYGTKWRPSALIDGAYEAELFFPSLGNGGRWCFFTAAPIKSPDGGIIGAVETFWDTTDDKRAEEENALLQAQVAKSEEKYRSLFNMDPHPIFILDITDHSIFDMNQRARDSYGFTRRDLLGMAFMGLGDGDDEELAEGLASLSTDQSLLFTKRRHYRKGGQPFYVNINISRANYGENDVIIASITDISGSVEKEKQLIQASKMTTLGQMAAGMAHELNQPLNVIQICVDYIQKTARKGTTISTEELLNLAEDISTNVGRASGIIRHMRDFSRQSEVMRRKINVNEPIQDVFKVLGHQIKVHQIELSLDLAPDLPMIMAEHNRLEQVFINLVTNAIDALDEMGKKTTQPDYRKRLTITTRSAGDKVIVTVADNGIGMPETVRDKIFEPFFTTKAVGKGTGLGVSISYGIVQDYDGTISIDSAHGAGTTFSLQFPAAA